MNDSRMKVAFVDALLDDFRYGYAAIYDGDSKHPICEGMPASLSKILDFKTLDMKSFVVTELEDGGVEIAIRV